MNSFHNTPETSGEGYEAIKIYGTDLVERRRFETSSAFCLEKPRTTRF